MHLRLLAIIVLVTLTSCAPKLQRFEYTRLTMGVEARIVLYAPGKVDADAASGAAYARLAELDAIMSDYRADSELMRLCAQPAGTPVRVSDDLFTVISTARLVSHASSGAFDITLGPLVALWREARESRTLPTAGQIERARRRVGFEHIAIDAEARTIALAVPHIQLDLGGIGKGYAAHQAILTLHERGVHSALVALAGDIAVSNAPPGENGWRIVIDHTPHAGSDQREDPDPADEDSFHIVILSNAAVSTSGSNQQFITIDGTRYSHLIDPRTSLGLTTETIVTVVSRHPTTAGALADALSSAACVLGRQRGAALVDQFPDCEAIFSQAK